MIARKTFRCVLVEAPVLIALVTEQGGTEIQYQSLSDHPAFVEISFQPASNAHALGLLDMVRGARFVLRHFTFKFTHTGGGEGRGKQDR